MITSRSYDELSRMDSFEERYKYCRITKNIGEPTFGSERFLNQSFYKSEEWKRIRDKVIIRDNGCDLGVPGNPIRGKIIIHHLNPLTINDITGETDALIDMNNLVCVSSETHNAIHYGDDTIVKDKTLVVRKPNDTCPWKK